MTQPIDFAQSAPKTALVTGATGFIGGHLIRHLTRLGWKVHALARQPSKDPTIAASASWHHYRGDYESASRALAISKPDVVFHLASHFLTEHKSEQVDALLNANLRFGMHLLEAMHHNNVGQLINTGTSWQHYNNAAYDPVNLYAATKQAFESIIDYYCNAHDLSAVTLKLFDTYGTHDNRGKLVSIISKAIQNQTELEMTDGNQAIHLVEVSDITAAYIWASSLTAPKEHKKYGIPSNRAITIKEAVSLLEHKYNKPAKVFWGAKPKLKRSMAYPPELQRIPGWAAQIAFPAEPAKT